MVEKICQLKLKMKVYILNTQKSGIKFKSLYIHNFIVNPFMMKYIKIKVKAFSSMLNTLFFNRYICIAAICIDSVLKVDKKNYPPVYLEQCKSRIKIRKSIDFIGAEVDLSSDSLDDLDD